MMPLIQVYNTHLYAKSAKKNYFLIIILMFQAPVFISFFFALRKMANLPVESLKDGGFLWLKDLTVHDPYYIMPIITSVTMFITIELGTDGTNIHAMGIMRYVLRALPFIVLPFMLHFPGVSNNNIDISVIDMRRINEDTCIS